MAPRTKTAQKEPDHMPRIPRHSRCDLMLCNSKLRTAQKRRFRNAGCGIVKVVSQISLISLLGEYKRKSPWETMEPVDVSSDGQGA
jgi:hypothetical protein